MIIQLVNGLTITNSHITDTTQIEVIKEWDDHHNQDGLRSSSVSVQLYANGKATGNVIILNSSNNWRHLYNNLPKYSNGKLIEYTVDEVNVPKG